jgi:hypothetical protein
VFEVWVSDFGGQGLRFAVWDLGFGVRASGLKVWGVRGWG